MNSDSAAEVSMVTSTPGEADVVTFAASDTFAAAVRPADKAHQQQHSHYCVHAVPLFQVCERSRPSRSLSSGDCQLAGQQVQRHVGVNRLTPQPAGKLMQHQSGSDAG